MCILNDQLIQQFVGRNPALEKPIMDAWYKVTNGLMASDPEKLIIALALFSYSMYNGPQVFDEVSNCAKQLGLQDELVYWADSWVRSNNGENKT